MHALRFGSRAKRLLTLLVIVVVAVLIVQGLASLVLALQIRGRFTTITRDSVPSILAAQNLRAQVQDMDADLANAVLENGNKGFRNEDWLALRSSSAKAVLDDIGKAYANVTFAGECQAIAALQTAFVDYSTAAGQVEQTVVQAGGKVGDASNPAAVVRYGQAADVLLSRMEPAIVQNPGAGSAAVFSCSADTVAGISGAGGLFTVNDNHERQAYDDGRSLIRVSIVAALVLGVLALVVAYATNLRLASATHRRFNLGLAGGSAAAVVIGALCLTQFTTLNGNFKTVSKDSLDSIRAALRLKAEGNLANADESRWLLDSANQGRWQSDFDTEAKLVADDIAAARDNITYAGERTAIDGSENTAAGAQCKGGLCAAWQSYLAVDTQIRVANRGGDHGGAVKTNLTTSNDAYSQFTTHVNELQAVNQKVYDSTASSAHTRSLVTGVASLIVALAGAAAVLYGAGLRLREL